jgi:ABC transport system ATP-binding/permease protein
VILVDAKGISMSRPGRPLFTDLSVTVATGDRLGVVGINGTGKSTLLRVLAGEIEPESGEMRRGRSATAALLPQDPALPAGRVQDAVGPDWEAAAVLDRLGMGDRAGDDTATLSGGEAKRVALARTLVAGADLLVLDEPTNHLDVDAIGWLEDRLASFGGGLVLVTHDRHLLDRVTTRILELDRGRSYIHDGGYQGYLEARARRGEREATAETTRRNLARRELAWLRRGAPARTRKPRARIAAAEALIGGGREPAARSADLDLHFGTPRLGSKVIELHSVGYTYAGGEPLFAGVDLLIGPGDRIGMVGLNGVGKSTLLDLVAGRRAPTDGMVVIGPTVHLAYYDQTGRDLDPEMRVRDAVAERGNPGWWDVKLLERFWFDADSQWAPIGDLSGGERRRLQLLLTLAERPNVLLLDEPTNDLDLDTLRALEDFLEEWPGSLVAVSHDRAFLERMVEDLLVFTPGEGPVEWPGGVAAWEAARAIRTSAPRRRAAPPTRGPEPRAGLRARCATSWRRRQRSWAHSARESRRSAPK